MDKGKRSIEALFCVYLIILSSVWLQLLSRDQTHTAVIKIPLALFTVTNIDAKVTDEIEILWEEANPYWVNISDAYYFMKQSTVEQVCFIWSSEKDNGYRHLYLVEKSRQDQKSKITQLTSGEWCCLDRPLFVDESRALVYFQAKMHTPLESHFYKLSYDSKVKGQPILLTQLGFSHTVTMNSPDYFVDCFSTIHDPQVIIVHQLHHEQQVEKRYAALLMPAAISSKCETPPSPPPSMSQGTNMANEYQQVESDYKSVEPNGEIFSFTTSDVFVCRSKIIWVSI
ncbi:dipeptidyl peptidase IV N-terminal region-domain-containing protein [Cokeromyces recurvatus]|uniref:dipeptidyl peptidase IV N-terminal region-domain-containing protein n=1 Tax=Cokeromyces recurvatus TaxID=90255 RepID=UPI00221F9078|nr:dipeptidyl peptidase IV N-terminal region-domain-containing protein [Cokeromyces recurvatus]KAI7900133.1 dipeptidyl peptidase IV N-terminal region-domain-containing protein [Cokeromyces recurvatus]